MVEGFVNGDNTIVADAGIVVVDDTLISYKPVELLSLRSHRETKLEGRQVTWELELTRKDGANWIR